MLNELEMLVLTCGGYTLTFILIKGEDPSLERTELIENVVVSVGGDIACPRRRRRAVRCGRDTCEGRLTAAAANRCWLTWLVILLPMFSTVLDILVERGG